MNFCNCIWPSKSVFCLFFLNKINCFCHLTWIGFLNCFRPVGPEDRGRVGGGETADLWPAAGRSSDCRVQQGDAGVVWNSPVSVEIKLWRNEWSLWDFLWCWTISFSDWSVCLRIPSSSLLIVLRKEWNWRLLILLLRFPSDLQLSPR